MRSTSANYSPIPIWENVFFRLGIHYAAVLALFLGVGVAFPSVTEYMDMERIRVVTSTQDLLGTSPAGEEGPMAGAHSTAALFTPERIIPVLMSMFGALLLALPIGWVYTWTGSSHKARQGVARALVMMPIAIAFVVFLVKGSLPLAFSLAGIVAAVRFRTSLSETTDGVFLFVVIGIGLAAGVQLLFVAYLASALFATFTLLVWGTRFAEDAPQLVGFRLVQGGLPEGKSSSGERRGADNGHGSTERSAKFLLRTSEPQKAVRVAGLVFPRFSKEWKPTDVSHEENGSTTLEFSAHLKKRYDPTAILEAFLEFGETQIEIVNPASRHQDHPTENPEV